MNLFSKAYAILFFLLFSWTVSGQEKWTGFIDGYYPVSMNLIWENDACSGTIHYESCDLIVNIYGEKTDALFLLNEYCLGEVAGHISMKKNGEIWSGFWKENDGTLELPIYMTKGNLEFPKMNVLFKKIGNETIYIYPNSPIVQVVKRFDSEKQTSTTEYFFRYDSNWSEYMAIKEDLVLDKEELFLVSNHFHQSTRGSQDFCIPVLNISWADSIERFMLAHLIAPKDELEGDGECEMQMNRWENRSYGYVDFDLVNEQLLVGSTHVVGEQIYVMPFCFDRKNERFIGIEDFIFKAKKTPNWYSEMSEDQYMTCDAFGVHVKSKFNPNEKQTCKSYSFDSLIKVLKNKSLAKILKQ